MTISISQKLTIASRMIEHIEYCLTQKMGLSDMFEYVNEDIDLNDANMSNLFNQVFFENFKMEQFA